MPSMTITITNVPSFAAVGIGYTFTGTVSLPAVVAGAIRINSMSLYYGYGRTYKVAPYLTALCGDTSFRTDYFTISETSQSSLKARTLNVLSWTAGSDHILRQNGRTITFTAQRDESTSSNIIDRPRGGDMTLTVDYTILQSGLTLSTTNVAAGSAITAQISAGDAAYSHKVIWQFGSRTQRDTLAAGVAADTLTVPLEWLDQISDAVTGLGSCRLETYSGSTLMGSETAYFNVSVPASVVPTIDSLTAMRVDNSVPEAWGLYIQGQSGAVIEAAGSGAYGSTITAWRIVGDGKSADSAVLDIASLAGSGDLIFTAAATDSRGRTAQKQIILAVVPYTGPVVREFNAVRATETGEADPTGAYLLVQVTAGIGDCGGNNQGLVTLQYRERGTVDWRSAVTGDSAEAGPWLIGEGGIDVTKAWDVQVILTDAFMTVTAQDLVTTAECYIDRMPGRNRLGIGGYCTRDNTLYVDPNWDIYHGEANIRALIEAAREAAEAALEAAASKNPLDNYPVGYIYFSYDSTSPASLFGGTWTQLTDRFLVGAGSSYAVGATGGAASSSHYHEQTHIFSNNSGYSNNTGYQFTIGASVYKGTVNTKSAAVSTMPPYLAVYMWRRTA